MRKLSLALVGAGGIGTTVLREIREGRLEGKVEPVLVCDRHLEKLKRIERWFPDCDTSTDLDDVMGAEADVLLEAASVEAAASLLPDALKRFDVIVMSVGALVLEEDLLSRCREVAEVTGHRLHVPSGAVGGLDVLRALRGRVREVTLTTIKHPKALNEDVSERTVLYEGSVRDAVRKFPKNINVAAAVSLAVGDPSLVTVRIVCDPEVSVNTHVIEVESSAGTYRFELKNEALPNNPKTSAVAAYSAVALIERMTEGIRVGT
ncbi:aspartate dehydrogenase [Methanopyrus sp.]